MTAIQIKNLRTKILQLSQEDFAEILSVSPKSVQRWENGNNRPKGSSLKNLQKLATISSDPKNRKAIFDILAAGGGGLGVSSFIGALGISAVATSSVIGIPLVAGGAYGLYLALKKFFEEED